MKQKLQINREGLHRSLENKTLHQIHCFWKINIMKSFIILPDDTIDNKVLHLYPQQLRFILEEIYFALLEIHVSLALKKQHC